MRDRQIGNRAYIARYFLLVSFETNKYETRWYIWTSSRPYVCELAIRKIFHKKMVDSLMNGALGSTTCRSATATAT